MTPQVRILVPSLKDDDDDEPEDSLHFGMQLKELPMVLVIRNLVHSVVTPRSDTSISARENICSSITQEDSNVRKDTTDPNLVSNLDQSKISPTKVIPSLNLDVEDRDKEDPLSFQTLSDKGINIGEVILESYSNSKILHSNYPDSKENTRNFENPIEEPIDNHEDIEMEFIVDGTLRIRSRKNIPFIAGSVFCKTKEIQIQKALPILHTSIPYVPSQTVHSKGLWFSKN